MGPGLQTGASLLVNADDFGLHRDIDRGILDCVERFRVQSVSFSPTGRALDWKKLAELNRAGVRIGVHITLVGEPWASDGRVIANWWEFLKRLILQSQQMKEAVACEIQQQVQICKDQGFNPQMLAHLDSHQHVHVFANVWDVCFRVARKHGIPRIRIPWCPARRIAKRGLPGLALQFLARQRSQQMQSFLPCLGLAHAGRNTAEIFGRELQYSASSGHPDVEMVVHPGRNTPELKSRDPDWDFDWEGERAALLSTQFADAAAANGYVLAAPRKPGD